jgi:hypothetical protein
MKRIAALLSSRPDLSARAAVSFNHSPTQSAATNQSGTSQTKPAKHRLERQCDPVTEPPVSVPAIRTHGSITMVDTGGLT